MTLPATPADYWDLYRPRLTTRPPADRFTWTGSDHGPGAELLGSPATVLDLGPADGENAAALARTGPWVTAVDYSPAQVARARRFWADEPNLEIVHADACNYLDQIPHRWDAIVSTWGAVWFTDPDRLLPRIARRLAPGGVFAFSHREPGAGEYGPQRMVGPWLDGRDDLTVHRWQYTGGQWAGLCKRHGLGDVDATVIPAAEPGALGTLLVTAQKAA